MSAKYDMLYPPLIERILAEEFGKKDPKKAAKTRLHQMFGAYLCGNAHKKAARLLKDAPTLLSLHASTKERLPHFENFYEFIATQVCVSGGVKIISDLGCGFNPFALPLMPAVLTENLAEYHAWDIDIRTRDLLNVYFAEMLLPQSAKCADLAVETPCEASDVTFMLKLIPVLEAQIAGRGFALANAQNTQFLVVTYPTKSLGGREKGMEKNYAAAFENAYASGGLSNFRLIANEKIGNELVYVLRSAVRR